MNLPSEAVAAAADYARFCYNSATFEKNPSQQPIVGTSGG
jgi:hypothetical protein